MIGDRGGCHVPILILVLLVDAAHESSGWRKDLIYEDEDGLLGRQLDAFADDVNELAHGEVRRYEVLLLIDGSDITLLDLFANNLWRHVLVRDKGGDCGTVRMGDAYGNTVGVLLANTLGLGLALLEGVLVLELGSHFGGLG